MDWYYKAALVIGLIWATARVLGAYGESSRELDINFLFGFMLTIGGWAAALLIADKVAKALGWRRTPEAVADQAVGTPVEPAPAASTPTAPGMAGRPQSGPETRPRRRARR